MKPQPRRGIRMARAIVFATCFYAFVGGVVSFLGWPLVMPRLTEWEANGIAIMPNTCLLMALAAAALILIQSGWHRVPLACGVVVGLIGFLNLLQHILGLDFGFNHQLLFGHRWGQMAVVRPGLMGPPGSISFTLIGAAIIALTRSETHPLSYGRLRRFVATAGLCVCSLMLLSLTGYLFQAHKFYAIPWLSAIALQTASMLMCLGVALVASVPEREPMKLITARSAAGTLARRLLPAVILLPPFFGYLRTLGGRYGLFDEGTGRSILIVSIVLSTSVMMWWALRVVAAKEQAERASSRYIEETLESLNDGFTRLDADGRFTYVNHRAEAMLMNRSQMLGHTWRELFPEVVGTDVDRAIERVMHDRMELELEHYYAPWDAWYLVKVHPMDDGGITTLFQDITDAKRMREALHQSEARLEEELARRTEQVTRAQRALATSERMAAVGTLASGLAHDINNIAMPLGLRMNRLLENSSLGREIHDHLVAIRSLLDHLRHMAKNLSLFARDPEQDGVVGWTELASWWGGIEGLIASSLFGTTDGHWRIELSDDIPAGLPPVNVSPHRLTQAVLNLVHNARDAILAANAGNAGDPTGPVAGHIRIEARKNGGGAFVELKVIDDGTGMPPDVLRRATEPFFTTRARSESAMGSGSGLGLALVHAISERSGGSLEIQSEMGRGTTITMMLPIASESAVASSKSDRDYGP